jgi:uncharacterized protein YdhG (YjbR/CyaY superfamily)
VLCSETLPKELCGLDPRKPQFKTIDEYIAAFPEADRMLLEQLRQTIHAAAPDAQEAISYQMPTFKLNGNLVHFAAFKQHIGFYPAPSGIEAFTQDLKPYVQSKGAVRFPKNQPLPLDLVTRIVAFRVEENRNKKAKKKN